MRVVPVPMQFTKIILPFQGNILGCEIKKGQRYTHNFLLVLMVKWFYFLHEKIVFVVIDSMTFPLSIFGKSV